MACYYPVSAWRTDAGEIVFAERGSIAAALTLPCGQCIGCRIERSRQWAVRVMHEAQCYEHSSFVTLTYTDEKVPKRGLRYKDFQDFMRRLRRARGPTRFYMCGEYGDKLGRPHFHACLFGQFFADRVLYSERDGSRLFTSAELDALWGKGMATVGDVTEQSAGYTARYIMKKISGPPAEDHYTRLDESTGELFQLPPEFNRMSLRPGIGARWFEKFHGDIFGEGKDGLLREGGFESRPPKYYMTLLDRLNADLADHVRQKRYERRQAGPDDQPARLEVRETVAKARLQFYKRIVE